MIVEFRFMRGAGRQLYVAYYDRKSTSASLANSGHTSAKSTTISSLPSPRLACVLASAQGNAVLNHDRFRFFFEPV